MKKLSGLIALLMCVVIGGVYANWAYSQTDDIQDKFAELNLGIADASQSGVNGEYEITSNATFKIYQKEGTNHEAELRIESSDDQDPILTIKFTPTASASVDVKANGVPTEIAFTTGSPFVYKMDNEGNYSATGTETAVLGFKNESNGVFEEENVITWNKQLADDGSVEYFYVTFNAEQLAQEVFLTDTFVLDTYLEYAAFQQSLLHAGNIIVKVSDGQGVLN